MWLYWLSPETDQRFFILYGCIDIRPKPINALKEILIAAFYFFTMQFRQSVNRNKVFKGTKPILPTINPIVKETNLPIIIMEVSLIYSRNEN